MTVKGLIFFAAEFGHCVIGVNTGRLAPVLPPAGESVNATNWRGLGGNRLRFRCAARNRQGDSRLPPLAWKRVVFDHNVPTRLARLLTAIDSALGISVATHYTTATCFADGRQIDSRQTWLAGRSGWCRCPLIAGGPCAMDTTLQFSSIFILAIQDWVSKCLLHIRTRPVDSLLAKQLVAIHHSAAGPGQDISTEPEL